MEIFFNELSIRPLVNTQEEARNRVLELLKTMKSLKQFDFNIIRTHNGFYGEQLSDDYTFGSFFGDQLVSQDLKLLLRTIIANPYIEDDESYEAELFVTNTFVTKNQNDEDVNPEGIASAFVFNSPTISISSHTHWKNNLLELKIISIDDVQIATQNRILNIYSAECIKSDAFKDWWSYLNPEIELNSEENIYKVFAKDVYKFDNEAVKNIISWYYDDKRYLIRVKELLEDIKHNPHIGGKGKTEVLKGNSGKASKRIVKKDRIIYTYKENKIIVHQCKGHYEDN